MKPPRIALGIRAQLLLVLTVFLALPWLGVEYVRELEGFLRDSQERTLMGTAQAVATALHDRPRLFDQPPMLRDGRAPQDLIEAAVARTSPAQGERAASPELDQILQALSRTTARITVVNREFDVLARAGTLKRRIRTAPDDAGMLRRAERTLLNPIYARLLNQPTEEFQEDNLGARIAATAEVQSALDGIPTAGRRLTLDEQATVVVAAHPIWVGDQVRGTVVVEETTNAVLAERNRAFERLFNIVLAALLVGSLALVFYATWLTRRIRRLSDDAERAIDAQGRLRGSIVPSTAQDEIGDLSRGLASVLSRLSEFASYQEKMASRLSHELRTPVAVVRTSLENLREASLPDEARVYIDRAHGGLSRLTDILARMTEAARLEQSLRETERERFDLATVVRGCVDGYRSAYPQRSFEFVPPPEPLPVDGAPELIAQMLDKLVANAVEFATGGTVEVRLSRTNGDASLSVENEGPPLPPETSGRLFDSMVSVRGGASDDAPHLGLGLYIARLVAEFHGGTIRAENRTDLSGVVVSATVPLAH